MRLVCAVLALCVATLAVRAGAGSDDGAAFAAGGNALGLDLYGRLRMRSGNLVLSPFSIASALAMTWAGARGETSARMKAVLHLDVPPDQALRTAGRLSATLRDPAQPIVFRIANRLFGETSEPLERGFLDATAAAFGAGLDPVDFKHAPAAARGRINGWVEDETRKRIRDLVPPSAIDSETRLVLVNALYFLGDWAAPFEQEATFAAPFTVAAGSAKDVPTMHRRGAYRLLHDRDLAVLEMPYKGGALAMLVLLPDQPDGLAALEASLSAVRIDAIVGALAPATVDLALPKFEVNPSVGMPLREELTALGMGVAFDRRRADFTGIANPKNPEDRLAIGDVFHKAFVKVDEKGTEAAAATAVVIARAGGAMAQAQSFKADHPFLFLIRHQASGAILFLGRVSDPSER